MKPLDIDGIFVFSQLLTQWLTITCQSITNKSIKTNTLHER